MRRKIVAILATAAVSAPCLAPAADITWAIEGVVTEQNNLGGLGIGVGSTFSFLLDFSSSAPLNNPLCVSNANPCRYDGASIFLRNLIVGPVGPLTLDFAADDPGLFIIRNNDPVGADPTPTDGVTFSRTDFGAVLPGNDVRSVDSWGVLFRTTDTNFMSDSSIPTDPTGYASLPLRTFQYCGASRSDDPNNCDLQSLVGTITAVRRVPEPGSLALLGLGLAGLGVSRRRRHA